MDAKKKTLLNPDHTPTLEELRAYFHENDFSAAAYKDLDFYEMDAEDAESLAGRYHPAKTG